jgi:hypothetical protein
MEQRTYTVYKFNELTKEQQVKALNNYRYINTDYSDWASPMLEGIQEKAEEAGFKIELRDIFYSISNSQGDGLCFDCKDFDLDKIVNWLELTKNRKFSHIWRYIKKYNLTEVFLLSLHKNSYGYHYSHSKTRYFEIDLDMECGRNSEALNFIVDQIMNNDLLLNAYRDFCNTAYRNLENYYSELNSDEMVKEALIANDYDFTSEGEID